MFAFLIGLVDNGILEDDWGHLARVIGAGLCHDEHQGNQKFRLHAFDEIVSGDLLGLEVCRLW